MWQRSAWVGVYVWLAAVLAGCASTPWQEDPANILGQAQLLAPCPAVAAADLFPLAARQMHYQITEGDGDGSAFPATLAAQGSQWVFTYEGLQSVHLHAAADGAIVITREDDLDEEVSVTYEPAIVMLPAHLQPGHPFEQTVTMVVRTLGEEEIRTRGPCRNVITLLGTQEVNTPAGKFQAVLIKMTRHVALPIARVDVDILTAYVPNKGQAAERVTQRTMALNFFATEEVREVRLK